MALAPEGRAARDDILVGDTPKALARRGRLKAVQVPGRLWKHSTLADIDGLVDLSGMFVFIFVRNPWGRVVSYYHWLRDKSFDHPAVAHAKMLDFSGFLNLAGTASSLQAAPYTSYVTGAGGMMQANLLIRLEQLAKDMAPLTAHLGYAPLLLVANQSARGRDWRPYYSDADAATLARICAPDIAAFGYGVEPKR